MFSYKNTLKKIYLVVLSTILFTGSFSFVYAEDLKYVPLAPLPGTTVSESDKSATLATYLPGLFKLFIGVGAVSAFVIITIYGLEIMLTDSLGTKMKAREMLDGAMWGLGLVIFAYVILNTINPNLLKGNLNIETPTVNNPPVVEAGAGGGTGGGGTGGTPGCKPPGCSSTYTNAVTGQTINLPVAVKPCESCSPVPNGLDVKTKTIGGVNALINTELGNNLVAVQNQRNGFPPFQLTETWPLTQDHLDQRQYNGTSVDLAFVQNTPATASQVINFINATGNNSIQAVFEVATPQRYNELMAQGVPAANLLNYNAQNIQNPTYTGEHFSIYKK